EGFESRVLGRLFRARVVAPADRSLQVFHELSAHLASRIAVEIEDLRSGERWRGDDVDRDAVRGAVDVARDILTRHAGVEITLFDAEDQITLAGHLELVIYSFTARWYYLLRGA